MDASITTGSRMTSPEKTMYPKPRSSTPRSGFHTRPCSHWRSRTGQRLLRTARLLLEKLDLPSEAVLPIPKRRELLLEPVESALIHRDGGLRPRRGLRPLFEL